MDCVQGSPLYISSETACFSSAAQLGCSCTRAGSLTGALLPAERGSTPSLNTKRGDGQAQASAHPSLGTPTLPSGPSGQRGDCL